MVPCYGQRIMIVPAPRSADGRTRHIAVSIANAGPSCGRCEAGDCRKAKLFHLSTAAQSELFDTDSENDPPQFKKCRALSSPRCPSARAVNVRTRPQLGLAKVFCISGSHLVRLVPQLESGRNAQSAFSDWHRVQTRARAGLYTRRPRWISLSDPKTLSATVVFQNL